MPIGTIETEGQLARFVEIALDPLRTVVKQLQSNGRVVRGEVSAAGAVNRGSGFTAVRNGLGDYTVTFDRPFDVAPIVVASPALSGIVGVQVHPAAGSVQFVTFDTALGLADSVFDFVAVQA